MIAQSRIPSLTLLALACLMATACRDPVEPERIPVVQLAPHASSIAVGDTLHLWLLRMLPPGYVPRVSWSSSDPATVRVERAGLSDAMVRGLRPGQAAITAVGKGASDSAVVTVVGPAG